MAQWYLLRHWQSKKPAVKERGMSCLFEPAHWMWRHEADKKAGASTRDARTGKSIHLAEAGDGVFSEGIWGQGYNCWGRTSRHRDFDCDKFR